MTITYNEKEREGMTMNNHSVHTLPVKRMPNNLTPNPLCVLQNIQGNPPSWSFAHFLGGFTTLSRLRSENAAMSRVQGRLHLDPSGGPKETEGDFCQWFGLKKRSMSIALLVADTEKMVWEPQHEVLIVLSRSKSSQAKESFDNISAKKGCLIVL